MPAPHQDTNNQDPMRNGKLRVWDRFLRVSHWVLVASISIALASGFFGGLSQLWLHLIGGIAALITVLLRIVWGFTGPGSARFSDFLPSPSAVITHLRGNDGRHLGHNPLGALMVLALIVAILALALTGGLALGGLFKIGPFAADGFALGTLSSTVHELLAFLLLAMVLAHLAGVAFESRRNRENLAAAMVTGNKPRRAGDILPSSAPAQLRASLALCIVLAVIVATSFATMASRPVEGLPAPMHESVAEECGACHMAFPASLLPAESWRYLVANLDDHFGEDASLSDSLSSEIADWLADHAAETADTYPAHAFSEPDPAAVGQITASPGWKAIHAGIDAPEFKRRPIYTAANCAACHKDAESGLFSPLAISIPKETTP